MAYILDTTLRDGSYLVNFQFNAQDTAAIASKLDTNGVQYIEIGHGLGLNASSNQKMRAASTDMEYLTAAAAAIKRAKWGTFFIPGVGRLEDIERAADLGMKFIRVGTNVTEVKDSKPYVELAKKKGLFVSANFMKTYALTPSQVAERSLLAEDFGCDIVCIVDSAGGMLEGDVEEYFSAIRKVSHVPIGFHGHNNLGMAVANTLKAVELGAEIVDTSLRGIGRSAGNAATEILVMVLKKRGLETGIDPLKVMDIAEKHIDPLLRNFTMIDSLSVVSGFAQFHSSFTDIVTKYAEQYGVDVRKLIIMLCDRDRLNADAEMVESIAKELSQQNSDNYRVSLPYLQKKAGTGSQNLGERTASIAHETHSLARKTGKRSVVNIVQSLRGRNHVSSAIYSGPLFVFGNAEVCDGKTALSAVEAIDGTVDYVLADTDMKSESSAEIIETISGTVRKSEMLPYSDLEIWGRCIVSLLKEKSGFPSHKAVIGIIGDGQLAKICEKNLALYGLTARSLADGNGAEEKYDILLCLSLVKDSNALRPLKNDGFLVDGLIGSLGEEAARWAHDNDIPVFRPDMRVHIHNEIANVLGMRRFVNRIQGQKNLGNTIIAAGGLLAPAGTVIVDSIEAPEKVFGIADGKGTLVEEAKMTEKQKVLIGEIEQKIL